MNIGILDEAGRANLKKAMFAGNRQAAQILLLCGEPAETVLPTLIALPPRRHETSFNGNGWMGRLGSAAVPKLVESLSHRDPRVRGFAAEALGQIGPAAKDAVPALIALLEDHTSRDSVNRRSGEVRDDAIEALGGIGRASAPAVPRLMALLAAMGPTADPDSWDSDDSLIDLINALGRIGPTAREAVPMLMGKARNDNGHLMESVSVALARIDPDSRHLVPCFKRFLAAVERESANEYFYPAFFPFRRDVGYHDVYFGDVVWELGAKVDWLVPDLRRMVFSSPLLNINSRCHGAYALARFPRERKDAVSYLKRVADVAFGDLLLQPGVMPDPHQGSGVATGLLNKIEESVAALGDEGP